MAPALLQAATLVLRAAASICPALPTCPQDDKCISTADGVSLQVNCATDYYGGDLQLAQTSTLAACIKACSTTTGCVAASYVGGNCYMKSELNAAVENTNVIGVAVASRETKTAAPTTAGQTCPASFTCPENDGCSYAMGSRTLTLSCGVDYYGGDIDNMYAESLEACTRFCASNTECAAASFVGGKGAGHCYLKGTKNGANFNDNVDAVFIVTATPSPSPSAVSSSSSSVATNSLVVSSHVTTSSTSSTPSPIASSTALSSSTSSTTTSSTPTPTPTNLGTCDATNSGVNLIENPSIETLGTVAGQRVASWVTSGSNVYPVTYQTAAHCGQSYIVFLANQQYMAGSMSQKITTALDTARSYAVTFFLNPYYSRGAPGNGCALEVYANDVRIFSRDLTSYPYKSPYWERYVSTAFTPKSSDVSLKMQYRCTATGDYETAILVDDITLAPA